MYPHSFGNNECIAFVIRMIATTKMHAIVVPVNRQNKVALCLSVKELRFPTQ